MREVGPTESGDYGIDPTRLHPANANLLLSAGRPDFLLGRGYPRSEVWGSPR